MKANGTLDALYPGRKVEIQIMEGKCLTGSLHQFLKLDQHIEVIEPIQKDG
jgi:hypothetical protein